MLLQNTTSMLGLMDRWLDNKCVWLRYSSLKRDLEIFERWKRNRVEANSMEDILGRVDISLN